jgi:hypothetical protein
MTAAAAWLWANRRIEERAVLPAVEAEVFASLSGRSSATPAEFWERLKAMGLAAVVLREDSAADLVERGEVLHFSRAEAGKLRALGLVSAGGGPKPDSLWAKDAKTLARLSSALAARGIAVSTASAGRVIELPPGVDLARVPAGFDPETVAAVSAAGLIPVAASTGAAVSVAGQRFWIRALPAAAHPPELMRAVYGRSKRLLILRPDPALGLEENMERLRSALGVVKAAGLPAVIAPEPAAQASGRFNFFLFYAFGLLGPLLATRVGLGAQRAVRSWVVTRAPIAAPVPEVLAGVAAVWATASATGLLAAGLLPPGAREACARSWTVWTLSAPLVLGALALFTSEGSSLQARWRAPVRVRDLAAAAGLALGLACLLAPRAFLGVAGVWESVDRLSAAADLLWWWPWRWREILVGVPSLVIALVLIDAREPGCQTCGPQFVGDPRGWLALGLFAPAGMVAAVGAGGVPMGMALFQGAAAFGLGSAVGLLLAVLRSRVDSRSLKSETR